MSRQRRIDILTGDGTHQKKGVANAAITPGDLIERMSTGNFRRHASAGLNTQGAKFALSEYLQGVEVDTDIAVSANFQYIHAQSGDEVAARLANGQTVVIGSPLESNGAGKLQLHTPDTMTESIGADSSSNVNTITVYSNQIVAYALEALDLSDSSGADPASDMFIVEIP